MGAIVGGFLADFWAKNRVGGRSRVQALGALCGAPFVFVCGATGELSIVIAAMVGFGFFKGIYDSNIWASLYDVVPVEKRGTAVGLTNMIGWLGGAWEPSCLAWPWMRACLKATPSPRPW